MKSAAVQTARPRRSYRQTARAASAQATRARVVEAFQPRLEEHWFEDIRLEDVARDAAVTVQTVIRLFGGKDGLLSATIDRMVDTAKLIRRTTSHEPAAAVRAIIRSYEDIGDLVMRLLAQEERHPAIRRVTDVGRVEHRALLAEFFADRLSPLPEIEARRRLDALVVATDLYVWKLIRRDMRRSVSELQALMERMIRSALA
ncbi:MAG TPA: hypothetical protein VGS12_14440 [Caulobacteraceae bacterium]|nr:hypothetical protein [Caulobacteraceae bacterium]